MPHWVPSPPSWILHASGMWGNLQEEGRGEAEAFCQAMLSPAKSPGTSPNPHTLFGLVPSTTAL